MIPTWSGKQIMVLIPKDGTHSLNDSNIVGLHYDENSDTANTNQKFYNQQIVNIQCKNPFNILSIIIIICWKPGTISCPIMVTLVLLFILSSLGISVSLSIISYISNSHM